MELIRKDGSRFWAEISAIFNRDENGKLFEILGVTRDISERKKAEDAFRESEKRYRMIVENMRESITLLDLNLQYVYQSPFRNTHYRLYAGRNHEDSVRTAGHTGILRPGD